MEADESIFDFGQDKEHNYSEPAIVTECRISLSLSTLLSDHQAVTSYPFEKV